MSLIQKLLPQIGLAIASLIFVSCNRPTPTANEPKPNITTPQASTPHETAPCPNAVTQEQIDNFIRAQLPEKVAFIYGEDEVKCSNGQTAFQTLVLVPAFKLVAPKDSKSENRLNVQGASRLAQLTFESERLSQEEQAKIKSHFVGKAADKLVLASKYLGSFFFQNRTLGIYPTLLHDLSWSDKLDQSESSLGIGSRAEASFYVDLSFGPKLDLTQRPEELDLILPHPKDNKVFYRAKKTRSGSFQAMIDGPLTARQVMNLMWNHLHRLGLTKAPQKSLNELRPIGAFYNLVAHYWPYLEITPAEAEIEWQDALLFAKDLWATPLPAGLSEEDELELNHVTLAALKFVRKVAPSKELTQFTDLLGQIEDLHLAPEDHEFHVGRIWWLAFQSPENKRIFLDFLKRVNRISASLDWIFAAVATEMLEFNLQKLDFLSRTLEWWVEAQGSDLAFSSIARISQNASDPNSIRSFAGIIAAIRGNVFSEKTFEVVKTMESRVRKFASGKGTAEFVYWLVMEDNISSQGFEKLAGLAERTYDAGVGPGSLNWAIEKLCAQKLAPERADLIIKAVAFLRDKGFALYKSPDFFGLREIEKLVLNEVITAANFDKKMPVIAAALKGGRNGQQIHTAYTIRDSLEYVDGKRAEPPWEKPSIGVPRDLEENYRFNRSRRAPAPDANHSLSCSNLN